MLIVTSANPIAHTIIGTITMSPAAKEAVRDHTITAWSVVDKKWH
ncbi:MAG: hypothetical protein ABFD79_02790 [Phycisphaerales bacterium]